MGWHLHFTLAVVTGSLLCWGGAEGFMQGHIALSAVSMSAGTRTAGPHARELGLRQRGLQVCGISRRYRPRGILVVSSVQESQEAGDDDAVGIDEVEKPAVETPNAWPCGDKLDKAIITLSIPAIINFLIVPFTGACDTFWVGRMGDAMKIAAQGSANQIFSTTFWVLGFLPSVITPLIAKAHASKDEKAVQKHVGEALAMAVAIGIIGTAIVVLLPQLLLNVVLPAGSPAIAIATPYLMIRGLTMIPSMIVTVGFSTFRGLVDTVTPLQVALVSNLIRVLLLPVFIFKLGLGLVGAGVATCLSDVISATVYLRLILKRKLTAPRKLFLLPNSSTLLSLMGAGLAVQMRTLSMNAVFILGAKTASAMDATGTNAAAHFITIQVWSLGGTMLLALSTVAAILVPRAVAEAEQAGAGLLPPKRTADRLLLWGLLSGAVLCLVQSGSIPMLSLFTPLQEVRDAAVAPSLIGAGLQLINGMVFVGEGIMQGHRAFKQLAINTLGASLGMYVSLQFMGNTLGGVWLSFMVFNALRLAGTLRHHFFQGPLALKHLPAR